MKSKTPNSGAKGAETRRWNRLLSKCEHNDREELIAFREFLIEGQGKMDAAWLERWGEYCGFTEQERAEIAARL